MATRDGRAPDLDAMIAWLSRVSIEANGAVPGWFQGAQASAPYPEAAGVVLRVLADERPGDELPLLARWLEGQVRPSGLVARGAIAYAFDTGIVLGGLLAAERAGVAVDETLLARMADALGRAVDARRSADPAPDVARWSTRWSCHQLKLVDALSAWEARTGDPETGARIDGLAEELLPLETEGRFQLSTDDTRSYVHASCYALEGVLALTLYHPDAHLTRGAFWLASIQEPSGTLPAWIGDGEESERRPTDVIAQAIRIWALVDAERYRAQIELGLAELARRQDERGGLFYLGPGAGSRDVNVWCTAFAIEALRAVRHLR